MRFSRTANKPDNQDIAMKKLSLLIAYSDLHVVFLPVFDG
jgi:hypothetical protein